MVLYRTLIWKVICGTRNGALKNHFKKFFWRSISGNGSLKNTVLKGSLKNQKLCLKETFFKVIWDTFIGSLKNYLRKWLFKEPWFERFCVEPEVVLLTHHSEDPSWLFPPSSWNRIVWRTVNKHTSVPLEDAVVLPRGVGGVSPKPTVPGAHSSRRPRRSAGWWSRRLRSVRLEAHVSLPGEKVVRLSSAPHADSSSGFTAPASEVAMANGEGSQLLRHQASGAGAPVCVCVC